MENSRPDTDIKLGHLEQFERTAPRACSSMRKHLGVVFERQRSLIFLLSPCPLGSKIFPPQVLQLILNLHLQKVSVSHFSSYNFLSFFSVIPYLHPDLLFKNVRYKRNKGILKIKFTGTYYVLYCGPHGPLQGSSASSVINQVIIILTI